MSNPIFENEIPLSVQISRTYSVNLWHMMRILDQHADEPEFIREVLDCAANVLVYVAIHGGEKVDEWMKFREAGGTYANEPDMDEGIRQLLGGES